eukprot:gene3639-4173_t
MYSPELPPMHDLDVQEFKIGKMTHENGDDRTKKRQVRLMKNRQSAALSRHRKKEYIVNLEAKAQELQILKHEIQQNYSVQATRSFDDQRQIEYLEEKLRVPNEEIIIGMNKMRSQPAPAYNPGYQSPQQQQQSPQQSQQQQQPQQPQRKSPSNNVVNQPFLSISNPNVNSQPVYLTRARSFIATVAIDAPAYKEHPKRPITIVTSHFKHCLIGLALTFASPASRPLIAFFLTPKTSPWLPPPLHQLSNVIHPSNSK